MSKDERAMPIIEAENLARTENAARQLTADERSRREIHAKAVALTFHPDQAVVDAAFMLLAANMMVNNALQAVRDEFGIGK